MNFTNLEDSITHEIEKVRSSHGMLDARTFARHILARADEFVLAEEAKLAAEREEKKAMRAKSKDDTAPVDTKTDDKSDKPAAKNDDVETVKSVPVRK